MHGGNYMKISGNYDLMHKTLALAYFVYVACIRVYQSVLRVFHLVCHFLLDFPATEVTDQVCAILGLN